MKKLYKPRSEIFNLMGRGQVSMEFLLIMGVAFVMIIPVLILFLTQSQDMQEDVSAAQIDKLANELVNAADNVYYLGAPSKKTIKAYMPSFVKNINFTSNRIIVNIDTGDRQYSIFKVTAANVSGTLSTDIGLHVIEITAESNGVKIEG